MRDVRDRQYGLTDEIGRLPGPQADGAAGMLAQTFTETTYPTSAQKVYACHPCVSDAGDDEGDSPDITADTSETVYAANVGTEIPASGTNVLIFGVGGRWVFRYDG